MQNINKNEQKIECKMGLCHFRSTIVGLEGCLTKIGRQDTSPHRLLWNFI